MAFDIIGKNGDAKVYASLIDDASKNQVQNMMDADISKFAQVRVMPDAHFGKGALVGTTIQLPDNFNDWRVSPNVVGVDIGCGMLTYKINQHDVNLEQLDGLMHNVIPTGKQHYQAPTASGMAFLKKFNQQGRVDLKDSAQRLLETSLGSLGGGNHFVEVTRDENDDLWLTVHSGSRNLGIQIANAWQKVADEHNPAENDFGYLTGDLLSGYLNDMNLVQEYAALNRQTMLETLVRELGLDVIDSFDSVHNFIDEQGTIRKGATDATLGKRLLIPLNMRDGSILAVGRGNADWNNSAPHGAGRVLGRNVAKQTLDMTEYQAQMADVYTTSVNEKTLDEAPNAYKPKAAIIENIGDTVEVETILKPIFNYKANN